jgi:hypothetical protein
MLYGNGKATLAFVTQTSHTANYLYNTLISIKLGSRCGNTLSGMQHA